MTPFRRIISLSTAVLAAASANAIAAPSAHEHQHDMKAAVEPASAAGKDAKAGVKDMMAEKSSPELGPLAGTQIGQAIGSIAPEGWPDKTAVFSDASGKADGAVFFRQAPGGAFVRVALEGLAPGWHGIHFHQVGDCSDGAAGFKKSGGHVNPDQHQHGLMQAGGAERGDLPNIYAGKDGVAIAEFYRPGVAIKTGGGEDLTQLTDADGFAVVIHASADDQTTQPIGGAGARLACAALKN